MGASVPSDRARFAKFSALVSHAAFLEIPSASKIDRPGCLCSSLGKRLFFGRRRSRSANPSAKRTKTFATLVWIAEPRRMPKDLKPGYHGSSGPNPASARSPDLGHSGDGCDHRVRRSASQRFSYRLAYFRDPHAGMRPPARGRVLLPALAPRCAPRIRSLEHGTGRRLRVDSTRTCPVLIAHHLSASVCYCYWRCGACGQRFFALSTNPQGLLRRRVEAGHAASLDGSASIRTPSLV